MRKEKRVEIEDGVGSCWRCMITIKRTLGELEQNKKLQKTGVEDGGEQAIKGTTVRFISDWKNEMSEKRREDGVFQKKKFGQEWNLVKREREREKEKVQV